MHFSIEKNTFLKSLSHGQTVVEKRTTMAILSHILIKAEDDHLLLSSTDMDITLQEKISAQVYKNGEVAISAHMLYDIVRKIPDGLITLEQKNNQVVITAGKAKFKLSFLSAEEFPVFPKEDLPNQINLSPIELKNLLDKVRFAMSSDESRYALNGIYLHSLLEDGQNYLRAVATDAHRLAYAQIPLGDELHDVPGVILAKKTVGELRKLLEETDDSIKINLSSNQAEFSLSQSMLQSRLVDGEFPQYNEAIPQENDKKVIVKTKELIAAVDRVSIVSTEKIKLITLSLKENTLSLHAESSELGSADEEMEIAATYATEEEAFSIGFNPKYLMDILQHVTSEEAEIHFSNPNSPAIIKGIDDQSSLFVLMPMRI